MVTGTLPKQNVIPVRQRVVVECTTYLVGLRDLLKFFLGKILIVRILIRMPLHGRLLVGLLELVGVDIGLDTEDRVIVFAHICAWHVPMTTMLEYRPVVEV